MSSDALILFLVQCNDNILNRTVRVLTKTQDKLMTKYWSIFIKEVKKEVSAYELAILEVRVKAIVVNFFFATSRKNFLMRS